MRKKMEGFTHAYSPQVWKKLESMQASFTLTHTSIHLCKQGYFTDLNSIHLLLHLNASAHAHTHTQCYKNLNMIFSYIKLILHYITV